MPSPVEERISRRTPSTSSSPRRFHRRGGDRAHRPRPARRLHLARRRGAARAPSQPPRRSGACTEVIHEAAPCCPLSPSPALRPAPVAPQARAQEPHLPAHARARHRRRRPRRGGHRHARWTLLREHPVQGEYCTQYEESDYRLVRYRNERASVSSVPALRGARSRRRCFRMASPGASKAFKTKKACTEAPPAVQTPQANDSGSATAPPAAPAPAPTSLAAPLRSLRLQLNASTRSRSWAIGRDFFVKHWSRILDGWSLSAVRPPAWSGRSSCSGRPSASTPCGARSAPPRCACSPPSPSRLHRARESVPPRPA